MMLESASGQYPETTTHLIDKLSTTAGFPQTPSLLFPNSLKPNEATLAKMTNIDQTHSTIPTIVSLPSSVNLL
jgi:hypothetical protein